MKIFTEKLSDDLSFYEIYGDIRSLLNLDIKLSNLNFIKNLLTLTIGFNKNKNRFEIVKNNNEINLNYLFPREVFSAKAVDIFNDYKQNKIDIDSASELIKECYIFEYRTRVNYLIEREISLSKSKRIDQDNVLKRLRERVVTPEITGINNIIAALCDRIKYDSKPAVKHTVINNLNYLSTFKKSRLFEVSDFLLAFDSLDDPNMLTKLNKCIELLLNLGLNYLIEPTIDHFQSSNRLNNICKDPDDINHTKSFVYQLIILNKYMDQKQLSKFIKAYNNQGAISKLTDMDLKLIFYTNSLNDDTFNLLFVFKELEQYIRKDDQ